MSLHINAQSGEIAETVLISGDPLRAKFIATSMLTDVFCYNEVRGMLGYTGYYNGKRVSVQGTGMGIPTTAIYVHELIHEYGVKKIIRVGTCGALQPSLQLGQIILATKAFTDSSTNMMHYGDMNFAPVADVNLMEQAESISKSLGIEIIKGEIFSTDTFYHDEINRWDAWIKKGLLGIEMETSILYTLASKNNIQAITIVAVSDNLITHASSSAKEREEVGKDIIKLALEIA